ncbi:Isoniazid-inducible protein iniA [Mycobacterium sp. ACS1612]|uniref:dynamin-like GTPase family protein n=1 Tax=Mycobacterium sp. ACS1612 TaxID=1834117 RepID=UPI0007FD7802|nr:dynamin-like GTPase family protein [Mycobacterium sp. ACS1612]OBF31591.1 Isoniazid-inducible protein iniA [Mycobacterium sp. ACS1612]
MTQQASDPRNVKLIVELIDHTTKIADLNDRGDLSERLARARARISDPRIRVIVAGQLKQGKSQLVNSLLNLNVCKVGDDESTAVATVVGYSEKPWARLVVAQPDGAEPEIIEIPTNELGSDLRRAPQAGGREVIRVEVGAPSPMLKSGLALVDTPGVGGYGQPHLAATLGLLPDADAVLMVSDLSQEFTEPEMTFMRQAFEMCPVAAIIATKTDIYPHWRDIVYANTTHLQRARIATPLIPVSSILRSHACATNDNELNEESNFPAIVRFLADSVLSRQNDRIRDQVLAEISATAEHLTLSLSPELEAINDPEARQKLTEDLERRKREAQDALTQTALWQQVLNDGIADLTGDVDHDLRSRFRAITQHTEKVIDGCDPTVCWVQLATELEDAVATAVGDNFVWAYQRAQALADEVGVTFAEAGIESVDAPLINAGDIGASFGGVKAVGKLEAKPIGKGHKVITGVRGSYGGMMMFGMLTSLAGLPMMNPLAVGAGLLLGRKAYKEDQENRLNRARGEAKVNMRRFIDDVSFVVNKESRDRLKVVQRQLRDHYREIANQANRSLNESLQATIASARLKEVESNTRVKELERQLKILRAVSEHISKLSPGAAAKSPASPQAAPAVVAVG